MCVCVYASVFVSTESEALEELDSQNITNTLTHGIANAHANAHENTLLHAHAHAHTGTCTRTCEPKNVTACNQQLRGY